MYELVSALVNDNVKDTDTHCNNKCIGGGLLTTDPHVLCIINCGYVYFNVACNLRSKLENLQTLKLYYNSF